MGISISRKVFIWMAIAFAGTALSISLYRYTYALGEPRRGPNAILSVERQWWKGASVLGVDRDANGVVDFKVAFPGASGEFHSHQIPIESWDDRDENGRFEVHAIFNDRELETLELDLDEDGKAEETLRGPEAQERFKALHQIPPQRPGASPSK
jgi:hypothetical protein